MIKKIHILVVLVLVFSINSFAQEKQAPSSRFGNTLNLGVGVGGYAGYYGYIGHNLPVFNINYEFDVARNFTLAPFISFYSYKRSYYWGDNDHEHRYYTYKQTVIPIGVKGTYYFDDLLHAGSKWDFYLAGSLGYTIVRSSWNSGYYGDRNYYKTPNALYLDLHIGTEFHVNKNIGLFLDLSTGVSTFGIAIH
ncbi:MAG: hypothetical protein ACK5B9_09515 [Flavobacteriia bacterium]|jgi:hypothetical protein